jgi:hypothetical protein
MASQDRIELLRKGAAAWNEWKCQNPHARPDLSGINLANKSLFDFNLSYAFLADSYLAGAHLDGVNLSGADLSGANLMVATMNNADLSGSRLDGAHLFGAELRGAILSHATLLGADLSKAKLINAVLSDAELTQANLSGSDASGARFLRTNLERAVLVRTDLSGAKLKGCRVHGLAAWDLILTGAEQEGLIVTRSDQPTVSVDDIEVAQFTYLLLDNSRIRSIVDTVTTKAVLVLGRFKKGRKAMLNKLRLELRGRGYVPILFDTACPDTRDLLSTISLLAHMARFIIVDVTDVRSVPIELQRIAPDLAVPIQAIIAAGSKLFALFASFWKHQWVLPPLEYDNPNSLLSRLDELVISPAEAKVRELQEIRAKFEASLRTRRPVS